MKLKLALLLLAALIPWSQGRIDRSLGRFRTQEEILYVWSGEYVKRLCPGFEDLMADVYWLRTVQYFGGQRAYAKDKRFDLLAPLTDITVTLDPRFEIAYHYGAIFLAENWPLGAGQPDKAIDLLSRGAAATGSWRLRQLEGYITFLYLGDAHRAADILLRASRQPGAAYWLKTLAADMLQRSGDRELARKIWLTMHDQSQPGAIRNNALFNLQLLDAKDAVDAAQAHVDAFIKRTGRRPRSLAEVRSATSVPFAIADPTGVPFEYDESSGTVSLATRSQYWSGSRVIP